MFQPIYFRWSLLALISCIVVVHSFSPLNTPNEHYHLSSLSSFSAAGNNGNNRQTNNSNNNNNNNLHNMNNIKGSIHHQSSSSSVPQPSTIVEYYDFLLGPNVEWKPENIVYACMETLMNDQVQGLEVCYAFSSDRCRAAIGGSLDRFQEYANNPVFGYLMNCIQWDMISIGPIIPGTNHRGPMQTCFMSVRTARHPPTPTTTNHRRRNNDDNASVNHPVTQYMDHQFLWTLQQERRPPLQGCWMIHEVLYVKNAFQQTM